MSETGLGGGRWIRVGVGLVCGAAAAAVGLWAGMFAMLFTFLFFEAWAAVWWWFALTRPWWGWAVVFAWPLLLGPFAWVPFWEFTRSQDAVLQIAQERGPERVPEPQLAAAALLHRALAAGATGVGLPEVGTMGAAMHDRLGLYDRTFHGDFPMRSPAVRAAARGLIDDVAQPDAGGTRLGEARLDWERWVDPADSLRVAAALDCPATLSGSVWVRGGTRWARLSARCYVSYAGGGAVPLGTFSGQPVVLERRLFHVLEEAGWLEPFEAVWRWEVHAEDPLLRDTVTVVREERERWLVGALGWLGL